MIGEEKLFQYNPEKTEFKHIIYKNQIIIQFNRKVIDGHAIKRLIGLINSVEAKFDKIKIPIIIVLGTIEFADKLTIVIFECMCYYVLKHCRRKIFLEYRVSDNDIWTAGIKSSPLLILGTNDMEHIEKYKQKFAGEIYQQHFRRVIKNDTTDILALSKLMGDVESFLRFYAVKEECRTRIAEVVVELMGNAGEHTKSDGIVDIDVTSPFMDNETGKIVYGINIVIMNFSDTLFGKCLRKKMESIMDCENESLCGERYQKVIEAHGNHKHNFDDSYTEEDFYNVASFQHRISGRGNDSETGGTGLTVLIKSLEEMSEAHRCYMLSGRRVINFHPNQIEYDQDDWISFNKTGDFINTIPEEGVIDSCPICFPGTAFNLNFVMYKEASYE